MKPKPFLRLLPLICAILLSQAVSFAVPARKGIINLLQPDGTVIQAILSGDEHGHLTTTLDGCAITQDEEGWWCYTRYDYYGHRLNTQTEKVLALRFGLAENPQETADALAAQIRDCGMHLQTGLVGTPYQLHELTRYGHTDIAWSLLLRKEYPGWLYSVSRGATTTWEHWDGIKPDGSFWSSDMNSFNHYAYGAIGEWMMRALAGIDLAKPGYRELILHPRPIEGLSFVSAWQKTPYGRVRCGWRIEDGEHTVNCTVPGGATAVLVLENADLPQVTESERLLSGEIPGIVRAWQSESDTMIELESGRYSFKWRA